MSKSPYKDLELGTNEGVGKYGYGVSNYFLHSITPLSDTTCLAIRSSSERSKVRRLVCLMRVPSSNHPWGLFAEVKKNGSSSGKWKVELGFPSYEPLHGKVFFETEEAANDFLEVVAKGITI